MNSHNLWRVSALGAGLLLGGAGCNHDASAPASVSADPAAAASPDRNAQMKHVQDNPDLTPEQKANMIASLKALQQTKPTK